MSNGTDFLREAVLLQDQDSNDPTGPEIGLPPLAGRYPVNHVATFIGRTSSAANVYRDYDEAIKDSLDNARFMRNDCGLMECIEARQRATALLDWTISPEDPNSHEQTELAAEMTKILSRIARFVEYRFNLLHAIWYGKYGIQHRYGWQDVGGKLRVLPTRMRENVGWVPINGDKLVFRFRTDTQQSHQLPYQLGIRVGAGYRQGDLLGDRLIEATDRGLAYFPKEFERRCIVVHKHGIEDGAYEDMLSGGMIHGVGVRSRIYWDWVQKQESLAFLVEYLERSAGGIELWRFPQGNDAAKREAEHAAKNRPGGGRNILLVPVPSGEDGYQYGVEVIEPGMGGIDTLQKLLTDYYGHRIKRYILGQVLSTEAEATGMGSGLAELHLDSFLQIVAYDASNLKETLTEELLRPLQIWNFPKSRHIRLEFKLITEETEVEQKLSAYHQAWQMGARIREEDVLDAISASVPGENDVVLQNPQIQQAQMMQQMGMGGMGGPEPEQAAGRPAQASVAVDLEQTLMDELTGAPEQYQAPAELRERVRDAARQTDRSPSEAQKSAGNYRKGVFSWNGMEISIENPRGSFRRGKNRLGVEWEVKLPAHYGYLRRTRSDADGDQVDVFVGPDPHSPVVFVVDQQDTDGRFDEHKCIIGCLSEEEARTLYRAAYSKGWRGLRSITCMTVPQFKAWLDEGDSSQPIEWQVSRYARTAPVAS